MASGSRNATGAIARLDRPWIAALLVAVCYATFGTARLAEFDFDPSAFVVAGDALVERDAAPTGLRIVENSTGYDGLFFYRLALDPNTSERVAHGITLDAPSYRQQRILYPLIAWSLAAGNPDRVPAMLLLANGLGLVAIAFLAAVLVRRADRHALFGCAVALYPGFLLAFARDLSEITEVAFVVGGLVAWRSRRFGLAAGLFSLAVLARETSVLVPVALAVASFVRSRDRRALWLLVAPAVLVAWHGALDARWGELPFQQSSTGLGFPFSGIAGFVAAYVPPTGAADISYVVGAAYLIGVVVITAFSMSWKDCDCGLALAWSGYLALACLQSFSVWTEDVAFLRANSELFLLSLLLLVQTESSQRRARWVGRAAALLWAAHALIRVDRL